MNSEMTRPMEILLVEDNPGDVRLVVEALRENRVPNRMTVAKDGVEAIEALRREGAYAKMGRPDIILLDLNLPRKDGRAVLEEIKSDAVLRSIPVVILTTSHAEQDITASYNLHANCYITKPVNLDQFVSVVQAIEEFWLSLVKLPGRAN